LLLVGQRTTSYGNINAIQENTINHDQDFDREVMLNLELVDATLDGTVTYEFFIAPNLSNLNSM